MGLRRRVEGLEANSIRSEEVVKETTAKLGQRLQAVEEAIKSMRDAEQVAKVDDRLKKVEEAMTKEEETTEEGMTNPSETGQTAAGSTRR